MGTRPKRAPSKPTDLESGQKTSPSEFCSVSNSLSNLGLSIPVPSTTRFAALPGERPGVWGVFYVELGRRDVHHDGRVCCVCHSLYRDLAVVGVTLLEGGNNVAS